MLPSCFGSQIDDENAEFGGRGKAAADEEVKEESEDDEESTF